MKKTFVLALSALLCSGLTAAVPPALVDLPLNEGDFAAVKDHGTGNAKVTVMHPEKMKWTDGPDGKALEFCSPEGGNVQRGHIKIVMPKGFDLTKPFTISLLVKTDKNLSKKGVSSVFRYADGFSKAPGLNLLISWNMFWFRFGVKGKSSDLLTKTSEKSILPGNWYRYAVVSDGKEAVVYLDGKIAAKGSLTVANPAGYNHFLLGSSGDGYGYGFAGIISRFKIFDKALTPAEMAELQSR